jgi:cell division protein FtsQ
MDGQRRIAEPVRRNPHFRADCAPRWRWLARGAAVMFLGAAIVRGVVMGGHLDYPGSPWLKLPGQIASTIGLAAIDIEFAGLLHHEPQDVLSHINIRPGGHMVGFDAKGARARLLELDWVESATVVRRIPNQLIITITEREPFVVWQNKGVLQVVDHGGKPMSGVRATAGNLLMHVVGEGANVAAATLVNQMESTAGLMVKLKAAVRVGDRRWDLHMKDGVTIQLPEQGVEAALKQAEAAYLDSSAQKLPLARLDLRLAGEIAYLPLRAMPAAADPQTTSSIQ